VELEQEYPEPYDCPSCSKIHNRKAVHLRLDADGDVIVSSPVYESLKIVFFAGLEIMNEVEKPPVMTVGAVERPNIHVVEYSLNGQNGEFNRPGLTKYESRDILHKTIKEQLRSTESDG